MVDLILVSFSAATFYGGFWCGAKFGTMAALTQAMKDKLRSLI